MKSRQVIWHVVFWVVYMAIFTFVEGGYGNNFDQAFQMEISYLPLRLVLVYFNYFYLLPKYLVTRKIGQYLIFTLLTIIVASIVQRILGYYIVNPIVFPGWQQSAIFEPYRTVQAAMILTSPMIFLLGITIIFQWAESEQKIQKLAKEKVETELKYLKNQINPHFFFNTLNNLYGLAQEKSDKTQEVVLRLSELMSYMLYETNKEMISLAKEIDYIKNYIALEEQRYGDRFKCKLDIDGTVEGVSIPPMIILPFIENSFKHGINKESEGAWLHIKIKHKGDRLFLEVTNSIVKDKRTPDESKGGLGIKNVERRLELLYPNAHKFSHGEEKDCYKVSLELEPSKYKMITHEL